MRVEMRGMRRGGTSAMGVGTELDLEVLSS